MIQIILLILKIIGIALLVLLGLILLALALVVFVPICYRVRLIWKPDQKEVKGRVSFLYPLFFMNFGWLKKLWYHVRVFGVALMDSEHAKEEKPKKEKTPKQKKSKEKSKKPESQKKREDAAAISEKREKQETANVKTKENVETSKQKKSGQEEKEKKGFFEKLWLKWEKVRNTIGNIIGKIQRMLRQKEEIKRILAEPRTKSVFSFVWNKCKRLLKHIFPRKIKGYVKYGSSDPATTGQVMGVISVLYAKTGRIVDIVPNFEEEQLECDLEFKGRIQIFTLIVIVLKVLMNEEIKQVIQEFKNIKEIE